MAVISKLPRRPKNHIENKNNPHEVTAEQTGAELNNNIPIDTSVHSTLKSWVKANVSSKRSMISANWNGFNFPDCPFTHWGMIYAFGHHLDNGVLVVLKFNTKELPCYRTLRDDDWLEDNWTTGCLPLTGGVINGQNLGLCGGFANFWAGNGQVNMFSRNVQNDDSNGRFIEICNSNAAQDVKYGINFTDITNNTWRRHNVFGEHNKSIGSYTGNSDASARTIDIGGIGDVLYLHSNNTGTCFVTNDGGLFFNSDSIRLLSYNEIHFVNGVLTIKTNRDEVNGLFTYNYQVL